MPSLSNIKQLLDEKFEKLEKDFAYRIELVEAENEELKRKVYDSTIKYEEEINKLKEEVGKLIAGQSKPSQLPPAIDVLEEINLREKKEEQYHCFWTPRNKF